MRAALRALSTVLIVTGTLLVADAALTVVWQEPVSALYARITQDSLGGDLRTLEQGGPTALESRALRALRGQERRTRYLARSLKRRTDEGDAAGRIRIPKIGADFVVLDGTGAAALRKGPGFFPQTPFPGTGGTVAIAGHRTTYGRPSAGSTTCAAATGSPSTCRTRASSTASSARGSSSRRRSR
jgi:sortase A